MNLPEIAEQKTHELLKEYAAQIPTMTLHRLMQLAFMRGFVYGSVDNNNKVDTRLLAKVDSLVRRG